MSGGAVEFGEHESELFDMNAESNDEAADYLASCDRLILADFADVTPIEGRSSTLGHVSAFMLMGNPLFHLRQISDYRPVAGMDSST